MEISCRHLVQIALQNLAKGSCTAASAEAVRSCPRFENRGSRFSRGADHHCQVRSRKRRPPKLKTEVEKTKLWWETSCIFLQNLQAKAVKSFRARHPSKNCAQVEVVKTQLSCWASSKTCELKFEKRDSCGRSLSKIAT